MTKGQDLLQAASEGNVWAREDLRQLGVMSDLVEAEVIRVLEETFPVPETRLYELGFDAFALADDVWEQVKGELKGTRPADYYEQQMAKACKKGCAYCCYLHVEVTCLECLAIAHYFTKSLPPEKLLILVQRVKETARRLQGHDSKTRIPHKIPCSLLDVETGTCTGYEVRPLSCRGYNSMKMSACASGWGVLDSFTPIEPWQAKTYDSFLFGVLKALKQAGLESELIELNQGLVWAFEALAESEKT